MYRLQYDADVEKHPTGLGRLYGPQALRAPPFLSPEIVRLSAVFSRLLTCVFSVHTPYYMTWATCGFRWHASGHRLATGMQPIASERSLSVLLRICTSANNSSVDRQGCILARVIAIIYEALAEVIVYLL